MLSDSFVLQFDRALRTVAGVHRAARTSPASGLPEAEMDAAARAEAAAPTCSSGRPLTVAPSSIE